MKAFVMCGAPGAGKSTEVSEILKQHPDAVVISGDNIRAELYGDADIQGVWSDIHNRMIQLLEENVGCTIIMDGTHYRSRYRKDAISLLNSYGYTDITAVVIDKPLEVCLAQNASRSRVVPEEVITKMYSSLQASLPHIHGEGFSQVIFVP